MGLKIHLKFCGGCNPEIERGEVAKQVDQLTHAGGFDVALTTRDDNIHLRLLLNGCPQACLEDDPSGLRECGALHFSTGRKG